ncbi:MAG TPA: Gfo/Idh/MocA family oxidoreductase, partial [Roseiflexaceae bacterium]|nr:Gfo/Idh/MocA family oxidoreductase [Roseiflexaceae bacterium]
MALCVAILGVGHWHAARYSTALAAAGVVVVAVSDHEPAVAARRGSELGCRSYDDHHALLAAEQPDFVVALPRPCDGAALVHDLLERGLPCLIEKPVVRRAAELAPLVARMQQQRAFVAVPFIGRLSPIWKVPAEDTADLLHGQLRIINGPPERYAQAGCGWMLDPAQAGGGALRNLGIHLADAAIHLAGRLDIIAARIGYGA